MFQAIDIKNFGATFAESGQNISITGAVQIGQGINKYYETNPQELQINSPFRIKDKDKNTTIGTKIISDEAHYFYPFSINPYAYKEFEKLGVENAEYTDKDYSLFKKTAIKAVTAHNTNSKMGCENELALFIETKIDTYLPNLSEYVEFKKGEGEDKNKITLNLKDILEKTGENILSIELYYDTNTTDISFEVEGVKYYDIFTMKEVL